MKTDITKYPLNLRILYLLPSPSMNGGMAVTTHMFYKIGLFEHKNIKHFDSGFKWSKNVFTRTIESALLKIKYIYILLKFKPDIIYVTVSPYWGFYDKILYCLIAKTFGIKTIFNSVSGGFIDFYENYKINNFLVKFLIKIPDAIVVGTKYWVGYYKKHFPTINIVEIANPVICNEYIKENSVKQENKIIVVSISRITKDKGIFDLVDVINRIVEISSDFEFHILGDGEDYDKTYKLLKKHIENGFVTMPGLIGGEQKINTITNADVFITLTHYDMMPISILEAMSAGLTVITTNVGGIPDVIEEGIHGFLIEKGNIIGFIEKLLFIKDKRNKDKLKDISTNCIEKVNSKYDISIVLKSQFELAEQIVRINE
ncbi:MAG: glycosyltransferase family 4 protein [Bacteroidia bacterium]|nr:glycosyltransferase family 4 protein [Bacteroidia bacterium]